SGTTLRGHSGNQWAHASVVEIKNGRAFAVTVHHLIQGNVWVGRDLARIEKVQKNLDLALITVDDRGYSSYKVIESQPKNTILYPINKTLVPVWPAKNKGSPGNCGL